jgi:hypothetical protein
MAPCKHAMLVDGQYNLSRLGVGSDFSLCHATTTNKQILCDFDGVPWRKNRLPEYSQIEIGVYTRSIIPVDSATKVMPPLPPLPPLPILP